jgi:hypothetical protein
MHACAHARQGRPFAPAAAFFRKARAEIDTAPACAVLAQMRQRREEFLNGSRIELPLAAESEENSPLVPFRPAMP